MTATAPSTDRRLLTIGAVCRSLKSEFPEISISKIRYLEDQGLLTPRRTQGGYRLFGEDDVDRLETILRLQRDEFLPLRVIRQELASPQTTDRRRRRPAGLTGDEADIDVDELCERAGTTIQLVRELEEYALVVPVSRDGQKRYAEGDVDVASACARMASFGISARHLRTFRTAADRQAALLEQLVGPALRSRSPERRQAGLEDLQTLAELSRELSQLLFWRDLRRLANA